MRIKTVNKIAKITSNVFFLISTILLIMFYIYDDVIYKNFYKQMGNFTFIIGTFFMAIELICTRELYNRLLNKKENKD